MQKISRILPGSSRITAVDLKSSRPVRPGVPSFGAPEGESNLRDQITRSRLTMTDPGTIEVPRWRSKEDAHAEIAKNITDQFFRKKVEQPPIELNDRRVMANDSVSHSKGFDEMDFIVEELTDDPNKDSLEMGSMPEFESSRPQPSATQYAASNGSRYETWA